MFTDKLHCCFSPFCFLAARPLSIAAEYTQFLSLEISSSLPMNELNMAMAHLRNENKGQ